MGIEPTPQAWEAYVLPLNYARINYYYDKISLKKIQLISFEGTKNLNFVPLIQFITQRVYLRLSKYVQIQLQFLL